MFLQREIIAQLQLRCVVSGRRCGDTGGLTLTDLIYGLPTWQMAIGVICFTVIFSLNALVLCTRLVNLHLEAAQLRKRHNELFGFNLALVGVLFAMRPAFIAVAASESFDRASDTAANEAALTGDIFRDLFEMPKPLKAQFVADMKQYVQIVPDREWPRDGAAEKHFARGVWRR